MITASIDANRCQGHARCFAFAPDLFEFDEHRYAQVPEERAQFATLPERLRLAIMNCPESAITAFESRDP